MKLLKRLTPHEAEIVNRLRDTGLSQKQLADEMKVPIYVVANAVRAARKKGELPSTTKVMNVLGHIREIPDGPRCACGLLLPCYHPTSYADYATSGMGAQSWVGEGRNRGESR